MACCVVLTRIPTNDIKDGLSVNSSKASSSVDSQCCSNPEPQVLSDNGHALPANDRQENGIDAPDLSNRNGMESQLKDRWAELLSQARQRAQRRSVKPGECVSLLLIANKDEEPNAVEVQSSAVSSSPACAIKDEEPNAVEVQSSAVPSSPACEAVNKLPEVSKDSNSTPRKSRERDLSRPSRKKAGRAASVEWDQSASEFAETSTVPQSKKRKVCGRQKRTSSVDPDWSGSDNDDSDTESIKGSYLCRICSKTFSRPWKLRAHLYRHINPNSKPHPCDVEGCTKGYFLKQHLVMHKSRSHSDLVVQEEIPCPAEGCYRLLKSVSGLKRHINKAHSKEGLKFSCSQCDMKFTKSKNLRYHIAQHDGQYPLRCKECNTGAFSETELRRHMRIHKRFNCDIPGCEQVFDNSGLLRKHKAEHNSCFSSLCCAHCGKTFTRKSNLREHVMTHLDNKPVFKCPHDSCPRVYYQLKNLNSHIRVKHEKNSNFSCNWENCDKHFMSKRAFTKHMNVHKYGITRKKKGPKAKRKDAGKPKRSMATKLTGFKVPQEVEQHLLSGGNDEKLSESEGDASSTKVDYSVSRILLGGSKLKGNVKKNPSDSTIAEDVELSDIRLNSESTDFTESVVKKQSDEKGSAEATNNATDEIDLTGTPVFINDSGNSIATLTGKVFIVDEDGVLVEMEESGVTNVDASDNVSKEQADVRDAELAGSLHSEVNCRNEFDGQEKEEGCNDCTHSGDLNGDKENPLVGSSVKDILPVQNESTSILTSLEGQENVGLSSKEAERTDHFVDLASNGESQFLSATLCAETIVEGQSSNAEREVLLVIPNTGQLTSMEEVLKLVNSDAVVKALSGDVEVYSMAEKSTTIDLAEGALLDQSSGETNQEHLKKISLNDPSVSSILQPLIQTLGCKSDEPEQKMCNGIEPLHLKDGTSVVESNVLLPSSPGEPKSIIATSVEGVHNEEQAPSSVCDENVSNLKTCSTKECIVVNSNNENTGCQKFINPAYIYSKKQKRSIARNTETKIFNPAYLQSMIRKFARIISIETIINQSKLSTPMCVKTTKENLQGPTQDCPESGNSSASDSDDSRSDNSGSEDDNDEWINEDNEVDDNVSDGGNGGDEDENDDGRSEDGDEDAEEQQEEEEEEDEEEDTADDEEDEDDDGGNGENDNGVGQLNGGNDDNNNNDQNGDHSDSNEPDQDIDPESQNGRGHSNLGDGSGLGVDRVSSPKHAIFDDSDAGRSAQSDDLVIVEESETEGFSAMRNIKGTDSKQHTEGNKPSKGRPVHCNLSVGGFPQPQTNTSRRTTLRKGSTPEHSSPKGLPSPKKCTRRSTRLRNLNATKATEETRICTRVTRSRRRPNTRESTAESVNGGSEDSTEDNGGSPINFKARKLELDSQEPPIHKRELAGSSKGKKSPIKKKVACRPGSQKEHRDSLTSIKGKEVQVDSISSKVPNKRKGRFQQSYFVKGEEKSSSDIESDSSDFEPRRKKKKFQGKGDILHRPHGLRTSIQEKEEQANQRKGGDSISLVGSDTLQTRLHDKSYVDDSDSDGSQNLKLILNEDEESNSNLRVSPDERLIDVKTSPASPSQDPLHVRHGGASHLMKKWKACQELSENQWISVLRQASKARNLSSYAADD